MRQSISITEKMNGPGIGSIALTGRTTTTMSDEYVPIKLS